MAKFSLYRADTRGVSSSGWMYTKHTFCFADYYDTERIHFGALRVINDMTMAPGKGLNSHPHSDIELILFTMKGDIIHKDSLGNEVELHEGSVQTMSAGTGYSHEEINKNMNQSAHILQFWIFPRKKGLTPDYSYKQFSFDEGSNKLQLLVSPDKRDDASWIQQDAWLYMAQVDSGKEITYRLNNKNNGVYLLTVSGSTECEGQLLEPEDGIGVWDTDQVSIKASKAARIVVIEVPMEVY